MNDLTAVTRGFFCIFQPFEKAGCARLLERDGLFLFFPASCFFWDAPEKFFPIPCFSGSGCAASRFSAMSADVAPQVVSPLLYLQCGQAVLPGSAVLEYFDDADAAPSENLAQRSHYAPGLPQEQVERKGRGRRAYHHTFYSPQQGARHAVSVFAHHAVDHTVEQHFQGARHAAPVAWSSHNEQLTLLQGLQYGGGIVSGHDTVTATAAGHASPAGGILQFVKAEVGDFRSSFLRFLAHGAEHAVDVASASRTGIEHQYVHDVCGSSE